MNAPAADDRDTPGTVTADELELYFVSDPDGFYRATRAEPPVIADAREAADIDIHLATREPD